VGRGTPAAKYVHKPINLLYYVDLGSDEWPWPIEPSADEFKKILERFSDEEFAEFLGGVIDGYRMVDYHTVEHHATIYIEISACKACPKRINLDVLRK
jgi:hypothetical protein